MDNLIQRAIESCQARINMYQCKLKNCTEISTLKLNKQILLEETKIKALQNPVVHCKDCKWLKDEVCCNDSSDWVADFPSEHSSCEFCERIESEG